MKRVFARPEPWSVVRWLREPHLRLPPAEPDAIRFWLVTNVSRHGGAEAEVHAASKLSVVGVQVRALLSTC